jgi:hypothetical protein
MLLSILVAALATAPCHKTFDQRMIKRAIDAEFHAARSVSRQDRKDVARFIRCARPEVDKRAMRRYRHTSSMAWHQRRLDATMSYAIASYYTTNGVGACGYGNVQGGYRFASLFLPCGAWVRFCHGSRCAAAEMADHGPYIGGRTFDLNSNLRAALGCGGICSVRYRRL